MYNNFCEKMNDILVKEGFARYVNPKQEQNQSPPSQVPSSPSSQPFGSYVYQSRPKSQPVPKFLPQSPSQNKSIESPSESQPVGNTEPETHPIRETVPRSEPVRLFFKDLPKLPLNDMCEFRAAVVYAPQLSEVFIQVTEGESALMFREMQSTLSQIQPEVGLWYHLYSFNL